MSTVIRFVEALALVYTIMIFAYIAMQMLPIPYSTTTARIREFLDETVGPYLRIFRRFVPALGGIDFSPMIGLLVLWIGVNRVLVPILASL